MPAQDSTGINLVVVKNVAVFKKENRTDREDLPYLREEIFGWVK